MNIPLLKSYVDDFILSMPAGEIYITLHIFNRPSEHLQFTVERKVMKIPSSISKCCFLERFITHECQKTWYWQLVSSPEAVSHGISKERVKKIVKTCVRSGCACLKFPLKWEHPQLVKKFSLSILFTEYYDYNKECKTISSLYIWTKVSL